jgi:hypothetical protein
MMSGKPQAEERARRAGHSEANLGQQEAKLEKASKAELDHLEGGVPVKAAKKEKAKVSRKSAS